jgi:hypothetical protein
MKRIRTVAAFGGSALYISADSLIRAARTGRASNAELRHGHHSAARFGS